MAILEGAGRAVGAERGQAHDDLGALLGGTPDPEGRGHVGGGGTGFDGVELDARSARWFKEYESLWPTEPLQDTSRKPFTITMAQTTIDEARGYRETTAAGGGLCDGYRVEADHAGGSFKIHT